MRNKCSTAFLQAGIHRLKGDSFREADSDKVSEVRKENEAWYFSGIKEAGMKLLPNDTARRSGFGMR